MDTETVIDQKKSKDSTNPIKGLEAIIIQTCREKKYREALSYIDLYLSSIGKNTEILELQGKIIHLLELQEKRSKSAGDQSQSRMDNYGSELSQSVTQGNEIDEGLDQHIFYSESAQVSPMLQTVPNAADVEISLDDIVRQDQSLQIRQPVLAEEDQLSKITPSAADAKESSGPISEAGTNSSPDPIEIDLPADKKVDKAKEKINQKEISASESTEFAPILPGQFTGVSFKIPDGQSIDFSETLPEIQLELPVQYQTIQQASVSQPDVFGQQKINSDSAEQKISLEPDLKMSDQNKEIHVMGDVSVTLPENLKQELLYTPISQAEKVEKTKAKAPLPEKIYLTESDAGQSEDDASVNNQKTEHQDLPEQNAIEKVMAASETKVIEPVKDIKKKLRPESERVAKIILQNLNVSCWDVENQRQPFLVENPVIAGEAKLDAENRKSIFQTDKTSENDSNTIVSDTTKQAASRENEEDIHDFFEKTHREKVSTQTPSNPEIYLSPPRQEKKSNSFRIIGLVVLVSLIISYLVLNWYPKENSDTAGKPFQSNQNKTLVNPQHQAKKIQTDSLEKSKVPVDQENKKTVPSQIRINDFNHKMNLAKQFYAKKYYVPALEQLKLAKEIQVTDELLELEKIINQEIDKQNY